MILKINSNIQLNDFEGKLLSKISQETNFQIHLYLFERAPSLKNTIRVIINNKKKKED